uniref:Secreted protein n=1 Tax=Romanomermis culicivorax TaxID=13658 RepID=A0A915J7P3_ROMCU
MNEYKALYFPRQLKLHAFLLILSTIEIRARPYVPMEPEDKKAKYNHKQPRKENGRIKKKRKEGKTKV